MIGEGDGLIDPLHSTGWMGPATMRQKRVRNALNAKADKHSRGANIECLAASNLLVRAKVLLSFALVTWSPLRMRFKDERQSR